MPRDDELLGDLQQKIGAERHELADLVRELKGDEERLEKARRRYTELGEALRHLGDEVDEKRRRAFAAKIDLEGKQQVRSSVEASPGARTLHRDQPFRSDKRIHHRAPFQLHVNFGGLKGFYSGFAVNISDGGMLVATCDPPPLGKRFAVEFEIALGRTIRAPVEAVWVQASEDVDESGAGIAEVGLRFLDMTPEDKAALKEFSEAYIDEWLSQDLAGR